LSSSKGGKKKFHQPQQRPRIPIPTTSNDDIYEDPNEYDDLYSNRLQSEIRKNSIKERVPSRKAPGPPNDPAPPCQPRFRPSIKIPSNHQQPNMEMLKKTIANQNILRRQKSQNEYQNELSQNMSFLNQRQAGRAHESRQRMSGDLTKNKEKPLPAGGRPKPPMRKINQQKARILYSYDKQDLDEISIIENDILEVIKEDPSGWWTGKNRFGEVGLFPGTYVEKI